MMAPKRLRKMALYLEFIAFNMRIDADDLKQNKRKQENVMPTEEQVEKMKQLAEKVAPLTEHIAQFFSYSHLPEHLQAVSKPFSDLKDVILTLPRNPERTVALRKLLEAKDAAVRAKLAKE